MKQALTETLAYFDENDQAFRMSDLRIYVAAARLVERLLPGECPNPMHGRPFSPNAIDVPDHCPDCVDGQVWDEGIVEAVARAIYKVVYPDREMDKSKTQDFYKAEARAVLSVLADL